MSLFRSSDSPAGPSQAEALTVRVQRASGRGEGKAEDRITLEAIEPLFHMKQSDAAAIVGVW